MRSAAVLWGRRGRRLDLLKVDWLALVFAAFVLVYALIPQSVLGGGATHKGVLYGARHDLLPVLAYFLGRGLELTPAELSRLCRTVLVTAAGVAAYGLLDVYLVSLSWWRHSAGWFGDQLGLTYHGLSGLPENFVYNEGGGVIFRRLTSSFLSPLATGYLLVVALFFLPLRGRRWAPPLAVLLFAALLATHTRAALLALVVGLLVLAALRRAAFPAGARGARRGARLRLREGVRPPRAARALHADGARAAGGERAQASGCEQRCDERERVVGERALRELPGGPPHGGPPPVGLRHRQRGRDRGADKVKVEAGESTYTELAVETGLLGGLAFVAWSLALLGRLRHGRGSRRRSRRCSSSGCRPT